MKNNYTYDYIHNTDVYVYQRRDMFRINTDTSLLANFMKVNEGEKVLDIGTNNGALLAAAARFRPAYMYGIEIQEEACELANHNLKQCEVPFEIVNDDVKNVEMPQVDVVVCNPPYFKVKEDSHVNEKESLKIARHECFLPFDDLCSKVSESLQEKGRFYLVHRADRVAELICVLHKNRLFVKTIQFIYDKNKEEAIGVLIESIKDGGMHTHILPSIINNR